MTLPVKISTDPTEGEISSVSDYVMQLKEKVLDAQISVREKDNNTAERQEKQYNCRVIEFNCNCGDLVWRNQMEAVPGVKCKLSWHWRDPWAITEKICAVLFNCSTHRIHRLTLCTDLTSNHTKEVPVQTAEVLFSLELKDGRQTNLETSSELITRYGNGYVDRCSVVSVLLHANILSGK